MSVDYNCYLVVGVPVEELTRSVKVPRYNEETGVPIVKLEWRSFLQLGDTELFEFENASELADSLGLEYISYYDNSDGVIGIIVRSIVVEEDLIEIVNKEITDMLTTCQETLDDEIIDNKEVAKVYLMKVAS